MTLRITLGIDPGLRGCVATLLDGEPGPFTDMPVKEAGLRTRRSKKPGAMPTQVQVWQIDAKELAMWIRALRSNHQGAFVQASLEQVGARPDDGGTSAFQFGEGFGKVKAVLEVLNVPYTLSTPKKWKNGMGLMGTDKDQARQLALKRFPSMAGNLRLKKHDGRADALLMALWLDNRV
jgi:hypothetical protein